MEENEGGSGFKIWAVDNVVYGPVDLPTLVAWVKEERVAAKTWIFSESSDRWNKASELTELQMFFRRSPITGATEPASPSQAGSVKRIKPGSLRRVKILAGMNDDQLERFVDYMDVVTVRQFTEIVRQGSPGDAMYLVLDGELRVRLMIGGRETILTTLAVGEFFGEIALFDQGRRSADVIANLDSQLLKISTSGFQKLVHDAPDLAAPFLFAIGRTLTSRIRADNKRYQDSITFARASH